MLNSPSKRLPTQSEDTHGISKTVFTHVSRLQDLLIDWIRVRDKGNKICKTIIALKLHECTDDYFPLQLQSLTDSLLQVLESFKDINEGVAVINKQLLAIAKLQQILQPVILTWTAKDISDNVNEVYKTLLEEVSLKKVVTENIAHCRDEKLLEVYATAWEIDSYFNVESTAYLFSEELLNQRVESLMLLLPRSQPQTSGGGVTLPSGARGKFIGSGGLFLKINVLSTSLLSYSEPGNPLRRDVPRTLVSFIDPETALNNLREKHLQHPATRLESKFEYQT